jgi:hypothetical protein
MKASVYQQRVQPSLYQQQTAHQTNKYSNIFLKQWNNLCYYNSAIQLVLAMPEVCDLIMSSQNNRNNILYKIIQQAGTTGGIVHPRTLENEYKTCAAPGITIGQTNPTEIQLGKLLEFDEINNKKEIKELLTGYDGLHYDQYNDNEADNEAKGRQRTLMTLTFEAKDNIKTLENIINMYETQFERHYKLNKKQKYVIVHINRPAVIGTTINQSTPTQEIKVSEHILINGKVMKLEGFIYYSGDHYVYFSLNEDNTWSLYDGMNSNIVKQREPLYNGRNVLNYSPIYLYKLVDCNKVLRP